MGAEFIDTPLLPNQVNEPSVSVHPLQNHRYNKLIDATNRVHEFSHLAGSLFAVVLLFIVVPFNAFGVGMLEVCNALLIRPWMKALDVMFSGFSMQTVIIAVLVTFSTLYGLKNTHDHYNRYQ